MKEEDLKPYGGYDPDLPMMVWVAETSLNSLRAKGYDFCGHLKEGKIVLYSELQWTMRATLNDKNTFTIAEFSEETPLELKLWDFEPMFILCQLNSEKSAKVFFQKEIAQHQYKPGEPSASMRMYLRCMEAFFGGEQP